MEMYVGECCLDEFLEQLWSRQGEGETGRRRRRCEAAAASQCGATFLEKKPASLLILGAEAFEELKPSLCALDTGLRVLYASERQTVAAVYAEGILEQRLREAEGWELLKSFGYGRRTVDGVLEHMAERYRRFRGKKAEFPHEMGLILGYPLGDVKGFIENRGRNFLCCGCWKVYEDVASARQLFDTYERARNRLMSEMLLKRLDLCQAVHRCLAGAG